jgi:DUF1680 family protein
MRLPLLLSLAAGVFAGTGPGSAAPPALPGNDYPIHPVPFTAVHLRDAFWEARQETNRVVTIPYAFKKCETTGRIRNFVLAGEVNDREISAGKFCTVYPFDDSDVYKIIEGASYSLSNHPDPSLDRYLDSLVALIADAQEPDGYLYTNRTIDPAHAHPWAGTERWVNDRLNLSHELYNLGHLYEAAAAHYAATGKRTLLAVALKSADLLCRVFGPDRMHTAPGHEEVEIGLVKLFRITGKKAYLDLARFFLDQRGRLLPRGESYAQDSIPVVDLQEAVGHAVRAGYLFAAMADVAALERDSSYLAAIDRLWDNVIWKKLYITGGIGARSWGEAFGDGYELPNRSAYDETCAAIANVFWNHRMFLLHGDAKYMDVLERVLYNNVISGVSLQGNTFFYTNPLEADGRRGFNQGVATRQQWFDCSCCPSNITRFLPSMSGYVYAVRGGAVYVNLFIGSDASFAVEGKRFALTQQTRYPWDGDVLLTLSPPRPVRCSLRLRVPGWLGAAPVAGTLYRYDDTLRQNPRLLVNGKSVTYRVEQGYAVVDREWRSGDRVEYRLPMAVRMITANAAVQADRGRACIGRGPIVYCAEEVDNGDEVLATVLPVRSSFSTAMQPALLNGVMTVETRAMRPVSREDRTYEPCTLRLIPYYAWDHRGVGQMEVWFRTDRVALPPEFSPSGTLFVDSLRLHAASYPGEQILFTTDGSNPLLHGTTWTGPVTLRTSGIVRGVCVRPGRDTSEFVEERYERGALKPAAAVTAAVPGLICSLYTGRWDSLPHFATMSPVRDTIVESIDRAAAGRDEDYALLWTGYLALPEDGVYTFAVRSDDGCRLLVDGEAVVDHDGVHAASTKVGQCALRTGMHRFRLEYFQGNGGSALNVTVRFPSGTTGALSPSSLFHERGR